MSIEALLWAVRMRGLDLAAKAVLVALADVARDRLAFPSVDTIAAATGAHHTTVPHALKRLEAAGLIVRTGQRRGLGGATVYALSLPRDDAGSSPENRVTSVDQATDGSSPEFRATSDPKFPGFPLEVARNSGDEPIEPNTRKKKNTRTRVSVSKFFTDIQPQLLADWQAVRKAKRAGPFSATLETHLRREAAKAGVTPAQAIEHCVAKGWGGFEARYLLDRGKPRAQQSFASMDYAKEVAR